MDNNLYAIRSFYEAKSGKGIIIVLSAQGGGKETFIRCYVPYKSHFETSPTSCIIKSLNGLGNRQARIDIPVEKLFDKN